MLWVGKGELILVSWLVEERVVAWERVCLTWWKGIGEEDTGGINHELEVEDPELAGAEVGNNYR